MQLSLLNDLLEPTLAIFPLHRRLSLVRETAVSLNSLNYSDGRRYWQTHLREIRRDLRRYNLNQQEIVEQVNRYTERVGLEVRALAAGPKGPRASRS
ncbi:DUF6074 family protein [Brucella anthropi]|uniref:DUF6074 family protein n=1 Tax=Brucella anthropi TaxID=529 RepID=UPI000ACB6724|nr:DUF6074 family protein [Brucella anthropi]